MQTVPRNSRIIEERLFGADGRLLAQTRTPEITNLITYRWRLGARVAQTSRRQYDGHPGAFFRLFDGRTLIVLLAHAE